MILAPSSQLWTPPWWRLPRWAEPARYTTGKLRRNSVTGKCKRSMATGKLGISGESSGVQACCICRTLCGASGPQFFSVTLASLTFCTCVQAGTSAGGLTTAYTVTGSGDATFEDIGTFNGGCDWVRNVPLEETDWTVTRYTDSSCATVDEERFYYFRTLVSLGFTGSSINVDLYVSTTAGTPPPGSAGDKLGSIFSTSTGGDTGCVTSTTKANQLLCTDSRAFATGGTATAARC